MEKKLTCFWITETAQNMRIEVCEKLDISKASFHRRMIDNFLNSDMHIDERLLIVKKTSEPDYIVRNTKEQIYLDSEREEKLIAAKEKLSLETGAKVTLTAILFQAMINYLAAVYPIIKDE